jgi:hypothetical protein
MNFWVTWQVPTAWTLNITVSLHPTTANFTVKFLVATRKKMTRKMKMQRISGLRRRQQQQQAALQRCGGSSSRSAGGAGVGAGVVWVGRVSRLLLRHWWLRRQRQQKQWVRVGAGGGTSLTAALLSMCCLMQERVRRLPAPAVDAKERWAGVV